MNEIRSNGSAGRRLRALLPVAVADRLPPFGVLIAGVLILWFSWPTLLSLHLNFAESADYEHGYLVFGLAAYLVIREFRRAPLAPSSGSVAGTACLLLLVLVVVAGHASTTVVVAQLALPLLWLSAVWALTGTRNARRFASPFAYLYFAIPVWNLLVEPMRRVTVDVVTAWTRAAGLPAFIEGNLIHVPTGTFEVEGGCAGLRYALVAVALAVFSCLLQRRRFVPSLGLTLFALALALVGNWLRVFFTVAAGLAPAAPIPLLVHNHHTLFGWVLFAVFMVPFFYLDRVMPVRGLDEAPSTGEFDRSLPAQNRTAVLVVCAVFALGVWLVGRVAEGGDAPSRTVASSAPELAGWVKSEDWRGATRPVFVGASAETAAWYVGGEGPRIGAYVAHYAVQRQAHEVVFAHNQSTGETGIVTAQQSLTVAVPSGIELPFRELEVADSRDERRLVWLEYRVAGRLAAADLSAKALQVEGAVRGRRDAQAVVLTARCGSDCEDARAALTKFAIAATQTLYEKAAGSAASAEWSSR